MDRRSDLESYEATEAGEIIRLLEQLDKPEVTAAPPSFQARVLERLEAKRARRKWLMWDFGYQVPVSLATGLVVGIAVAPFFLSLETEKSSLDEPTVFRTVNSSPSSRQGDFGTPSDGQSFESPEEWLEFTAELLVTGQVSDAYEQLKVFRQRYPRYEADSGNR